MSITSSYCWISNCLIRASCNLQAVEHICKEVVAIKVVDAASMDPWVYEGAKNEVELLRMLKGRPGVIQMIDSEVTALK